MWNRSCKSFYSSEVLNEISLFIYISISYFQQLVLDSYNKVEIKKWLSDLTNVANGCCWFGFGDIGMGKS